MMGPSATVSGAGTALRRARYRRGARRMPWPTSASRDPHRPGFAFPACPFKLLTGWNCPACGGLRMTHDLLHGDLGRRGRRQRLPARRAARVAGVWLVVRWRAGTTDRSMPAIAVIAVSRGHLDGGPQPAGVPAGPDDSRRVAAAAALIHFASRAAAVPDEEFAGLRRYIPMLFSALPRAQGLYDPEHETDSCGVAMITDIQGRRSHSIVADGLIALEHLEHRGAAGAEPNSGDGAGILLQLPVELLRATSSTSTYLRRPPTAATPSPPESASCRRIRPTASHACERIEAIAVDEGLRSARLARGSGRPRRAPTSVRPRSAACRTWRSCSSPHPSRRQRPAASTSTAGSTRCASGPSSGRGLLPVAVQPDHRLQGHAHDDAAAAVLSGPARRTLHQRDRDRAQPLLDQHLPVLAAGAPVPLRRPQRRDQHRPRQPQPHARPRGDAGERPDPRRPGRLSPICTAGGLGFGVLRPGARAAAPRRPQPAACRPDDDPRGVGEQRAHGPGRVGRSGSSTRR